MISCIEEINTKILHELIGVSCFVKSDKGEMIECEITRADIFISKHGIGVNVHLKGPKGRIVDYPQCVLLENYSSNTSYLQPGFLTPMSYAKFYCELG